MSDIHELIERALAIHFSQNRQPHMSGDPRERLSALQRRNMEDARDAVIAALGIPVETLRGLRDGSLVAVPREPIKQIRDACIFAHGPLLHPSLEDAIATIRLHAEAMLAAAQEPQHDR